VFDAKPQDRETIALYPRDILRDHKPGPDGNLIEVHRIVFGKKGTTNYEQGWEVPRLKKEDPTLWEAVRPVYERWLASNTITREGFPLESWPAITKGKLKACRDLGLVVVEDLASATDSTREKLGMGALELIQKARSFISSQGVSATANRIADLEKVVADQADALKEARETIDALMAAQGKQPGRPPRAGRKAEDGDG